MPGGTGSAPVHRACHAAGLARARPDMSREAFSRHARSVFQFASTLRTRRPQDDALARRPGRRAPPRATVREARAPLPQWSLAPARVLLSRAVIAFYDPIRQSRGHAGISRPCRLYPVPAPCGRTAHTLKTRIRRTLHVGLEVADPKVGRSPADPTSSRCREVVQDAGTLC